MFTFTKCSVTKCTEAASIYVPIVLPLLNGRFVEMDIKVDLVSPACSDHADLIRKLTVGIQEGDNTDGN